MANETFQIGAEQAEAYEARFVPALFRQWVEPMLEAAAIQPGDRVLDVACGTGVVARAAYDLVTPGGSVTGVDLNPAMLAVAQRVAPEIDWRSDSAPKAGDPAWAAAIREAIAGWKVVVPAPPPPHDPFEEP